MNDGLGNCKFFFFFVSKSSLQSTMVKLEWQNAILKTSNGSAKFIPVKLDDCLMPELLLQTLYIDVYGKGIENAIKQMIDVINGNLKFQPQFQTYENVRSYLSEKTSHELTIKIQAESDMEPISRYAILVNNSESDISLKCLSDSMYSSGFTPHITLSTGLTCNAIGVTINRPTSPGFPVTLKLSSKSPIIFKGVMRAISEDEFKVIPIIA